MTDSIREILVPGQEDAIKRKVAAMRGTIEYLDLESGVLWIRFPETKKLLVIKR
jgi:hypothetical protein